MGVGGDAPRLVAGRPDSAVITQQPTSEAAQLADIIIAPQTGPEAVAG